MTDDKLQPTGSDVDTAQLLAKDLGVAARDRDHHRALRASRCCRPTRPTWSISTLSITPERAKVIDFSMPYADHPSVVGGAERRSRSRSYADLAGKKVAVVRGTTQDTDLTREAKGAQLVRYEDDATMALAFASGQVDILATARSLLPAISKKNPARTAESQHHHADLLSRGRHAQGRAASSRPGSNGWVKTNLQNGKLGAIYKKYHGIDIPADQLLKAGMSSCSSGPRASARSCS